MILVVALIVSIVGSRIRIRRLEKIKEDSVPKTHGDHQYIIVIECVKDGEYHAWHPEFGRGSVLGIGATLIEAVEELGKGRECTIECLKENGMPVPEPANHEGSEVCPKCVGNGRIFAFRGSPQDEDVREVVKDFVGKFPKCQCKFPSYTAGVCYNCGGIRDLSKG